ncbi:NAC domain-containing protein, partial [Trifolium pratense]
MKKVGRSKEKKGKIRLSNQGPGFRFHPTDEEIVCFYVKRKLTRKLPPCFDHLSVIDIYKFEPWDLPSLSKLKTRDLEWYFFSGLDKKYGSSSNRTNRATDRGYWKTTGKDRVIKNGEVTVGMKKTLVYHLGRAPHGERSNWKSGSGPKNGEKYGAPFVEAEWVENVVEENGEEKYGAPFVEEAEWEKNVVQGQILPLPPVNKEVLKQDLSASDINEWVDS